MIVGDGDIARAIKDRDDLLFFASGVSNSKETRKSEFERESKLLLKQPFDNHVVYFSSLSIFYSDSLYAKHKRNMEEAVKFFFPSWTIMRFGNITWGDNPHTLINYFRKQKKEGKELIIEDAYRFICDRDEFNYWISMIPEWNCEMNVPGVRMKVSDIVKEFI